MSPETFFIGYKAIPPALKRFYTAVVIVLLAITAGAGYSIANLHQHSEPGLWETDEKITLQGYLGIDPYPVLHQHPGTDGSAAESILLVATGKFSATPIAQDFAGQTVSVSGYLIQRGGWKMLEIEADAISIDTTPAATEQPLTEKSLALGESLGKLSLDGEIMDSKCFLGVMKPGSGPVHKACAELCMLGGVPPMLVATGTDGLRYGYLLTKADGSSASTEVAKLAGEKVSVSGEMMRHGDLVSIRLDSLSTD